MPLETVNYNIMSLVNMLKLSKKFKIKRFVQASSVYADSEEGGFMGEAKGLQKITWLSLIKSLIYLIQF